MAEKSSWLRRLEEEVVPGPAVPTVDPDLAAQNVRDLNQDQDPSLHDDHDHLLFVEHARDPDRGNNEGQDLGLVNNVDVLFLWRGKMLLQTKDQLLAAEVLKEWKEAEVVLLPKEWKEVEVVLLLLKEWKEVDPVPVPRTGSKKEMELNPITRKIRSK